MVIFGRAINLFTNTMNHSIFNDRKSKFTFSPEETVPTQSNVYLFPAILLIHLRIFLSI